MQADLASAALAGLARQGVLAVGILRGGRIAWASPALLAMFGLDPAAADGKPFLDLVATEDREVLARALEGASGTATLPIPFRALRAGSTPFESELTGVALDLPGGGGLAVAVSDVTEQHRAQARLSYLALRDPLTELPNRALFFDRLGQALAAARRGGGKFAVLVGDLDGFKAINDRYGHETGDALLQAAAKRLRAAVREDDTVARIGGDEFSALLTRAPTPEDASVVAARMVRALAAPVVIAGQPCLVGISIGIARYPLNGKDMDELVAHADGAMYAAKRAGGNRVQFARLRDADVTGPLRLPFFVWSEAHTLGVPLMDEQHKALAALINGLNQELKAGHDPEHLGKSLVSLVQAAHAHLADEQRLLATAGMAAAAERHKKEHRTLIQDLESQTSRLDSRSMSLTMHFVNDWLSRHIETDGPYARQLLARGMGS